jgi:hypothetical protein
MSEPRKKLPLSLIVLLVLLTGVCIGIFFFMRHGFYLFHTFKPADADKLMPSTPGFP